MISEDVSRPLESVPADEGAGEGAEAAGHGDEPLVTDDGMTSRWWRADHDIVRSITRRRRPGGRSARPAGARRSACHAAGDAHSARHRR